MGLRKILNRLQCSPALRVYAFRAVLLSTMSTLIAAWIVNSSLYPAVYYGPCLPVLIHHIAMLYPWRINLVVFEILLVTVEWMCFCAVFGLCWNIPSLSPFFAVDILALSLSLYFRYMGRTLGRFDLFAGCDVDANQPLYKPMEIIFGRSSLRPLVRGESRAIALFRVIILLSLCFVIPTFGGYFALVVPFRATVIARTIKVATPWNIYSSDSIDGPLVGLFTENIVMLFIYVNNLNPLATANVTVARSMGNLGAVTQLCGNLIPIGIPVSPQGPTEVASNFPDSGGGGILYVKPGQGDPSDTDSYAEVIPLMAGSRLSAILSRTERDLFSNNAQDIFGITTPYRSIMLTPVLLMQADPFPPAALGPNSSSLRLRMRDDVLYSHQTVRDFTDSSVLNGLATAGGFWTFVNGAFAMVFGANILYFLFRRRPLSALGIVHVFQRRKLNRNWNEDFPALYTEGGLPRSRSAGILAFLRKRLVDLDDKDNGPADLESQIPPADPENHPLVYNTDIDAARSCVTGVDQEVQTDSMEMEEIVCSSGSAVPNPDARERK
ncbi:hypothetical protein DFH06DRAFT_1480114 [Mycena polygramma]|nr:hypothetical protein DFH06DRAFT_1480114 [Mycena polygramma]